MRFERLDLNLLVALDVLIAERSVSAAAKRLHLSQPAVSGALNRLREFFDDDLLVQIGRQMILTPRAEDLAGPVGDALLFIKTRITTPNVFDPATAERTFTVVVSDYAFSVFFAKVIAKSAALAPRVQFELLPPEQSAIERLQRGDLDLLLTVEPYALPDLPHITLFRDEHSVVCWADGRYKDGIDRDAFLGASHAAAYFGRSRFPSIAEIFYEETGISRRIEVRVPSFMMLPQAVIGTDRVATMHYRLSNYYARFLPLRVWPIPLAMPEVVEVAQWHTIRDSDEGLKWLVSLLREEACEMTNPR